MTAPQPRQMITRYVVTCLPEDVRSWYAWSLTVDYRGRGQWVVLRAGEAVNAAGEWEVECSPSNRSAEFQNGFYTDLDTALATARRIAPLLDVNGLTAADVLSREATRP